MSDKPSTKPESLRPSQARRLDSRCDEFEAAWQGDERPRLEEYLQDVPPDDVGELLRELLAIELAYRRQRGETPPLEEYQERFPEQRTIAETVFRENDSFRFAQTVTELPAQPQFEGNKSDVSATWKPPDIPGYEILEELGRGGMGVVYKARHVQLNRLVALKMILAGDYAGSEEVQRFLSEAEAVAAFSHPNIVQVYDFGRHQNFPYMALEFVDGGSLADKLKDNPLPARDAAQLVEQIAHGMNAAHQAGIVHRDLKPGNVLLTADGTPKVADFGLAKQVASGQVASGVASAPRGDVAASGVASATRVSDLTRTGAIVGTPSFMAPEQASGEGKRVGPAADIYALGAVLYKCLTGRPPFQAATPLDTVLQVISQEPVPPSHLVPKLPKDVETICLKCLQKEPQKRYDSAQELGNDLRRFLNKEPITARPVRKVERAWRWCRRNPALAVAGSFTASTLVAMFIVLAVMLQNAIQLSKSNEARAKAEENARKEGQARLVAGKQARKRADRDAAKLQFEQALAKCQREDPVQAVLWLARSLVKAHEAKAPQVEASIRLHLGAWRPHELRMVLRQPSKVNVAKFSPDGKVLLLGNQNNAAQLWHVATGNPIASLLKHKGRVLAADFSPDGNIVLTGSEDGTAQLWDVSTGKPVGPRLKHRSDVVFPEIGLMDKSSVVAVAFSPNGKTALTVGKDTRDPCSTVKIWNSNSGKLLKPPLICNPLSDVAFSPNGKKLLTGSVECAKLWEVSTRESVVIQQSLVNSVAFSPDGKFVLTANDREARLSVAASGKPLWRFLIGGRVVVAFNPAGTKFLVGSDEGTASLGDVATGKQLGPSLLHQGIVVVMFNWDGNLMLTGGKDGTARLWHTASGTPIGPTIGPLLQDQGAVGPVVFSPDGKMVLTRSEKIIRVWDVCARRPLTPALHHRNLAENCLAFSPDGKTVLTRNPVRLWDADSGRPWAQPLPHERIQKAFFSPNGKMVLTVGADQTLQIWNAENGHPLGARLHNQDNFRAVAFSPNGRKVLIANGRKVQLRDAASSRPLGVSLGHQDIVRSLVYSPDGKTVLTGSNDMKARLWIAETGKALGRPLKHDGPVIALAFSPNGKTVITGSTDKTARLWVAATGKPLAVPFRHQGKVVTVAFSPDGKTVLTGGGKTVRLWIASNGESLGPPLEHENLVTSAAFSPDGKIVVTGSTDKTTRLWEVATGKPLGAPLRHSRDVIKVAFTPDGKTLLTRTSGRGAQLWPIPTAVRARPDRILLWSQVITGKEIDEHGVTRVLNLNVWHERRRQLNDLGGP